MKARRPIVEFLCRDDDRGVIPEPVPARSALPNWYRRLPGIDQSELSATNDGVTVKRCLPFLDAMTAGWIIPLAATVRLEVRDDGKSVDAGWEFDRTMVSNHGGDALTRRLRHQNDAEMTEGADERASGRSERGRFADFAGIDAHPRPIQSPIPLVIGGHTPAAYRRAVSRGRGWYGLALTPETTAASIAGLGEAAASVDRRADLGELEITVTPRGRLTAESAAAFAELGVDRLVIIPDPKADDARPSIDAAIEAVR